ncbi:MAG: hypothetical protein ACO1N3_01540 [Gammaproteobacteria bacterium]
MQAKELIIRTLVERLNLVSVPQESKPSAEKIAKFNAELRKIFFAAVYATDGKDYSYLKRWASINIHPDKLLQTTNRPEFTQSLSRAQSKDVQVLPIQTFNEFMDSINALANEKGNINQTLTSLSIFWENNVQAYPEDASEQDKKLIDSHNHQIIFYILYCLNSLTLNASIDLLYKYYRYPKDLAKLFYYINATLNALLTLAFFVPIIIFLVLACIRYMLYGVERSLLNLITQNHYYTYVEREFSIALGRKKVFLNEDLIPETPNETLIQITDDEAYTEGQKLLDEEVLRLYQEELNAFNENRASIPSSQGTLKHNLCSQYNSNAHLRHVIASLSSYFKQVFRSNSSWTTLVWGVCRLGMAIVVVLGMSLPLAALKRLQLLSFWAVEAAVLSAALLIKYVSALIFASPLYLYDAYLWVRGADVNNTSRAKFAADILWSASFFKTEIGKRAKETASSVFGEIFKQNTNAGLILG